MRILLIFCYCASAWGQILLPILGGGCVTPPGTTLTDSFGEGLYACGFNSDTGCGQMWITTGAGTVALVATPASATSGSCARSLDLSGTATVSTYGSMPTIPAGSTVDVEFSLRIRTAGTPSFVTLFQLYNASGSGSGAVGINGANLFGASYGLGATSSNFATSINTWYKVHLHLAAGAAASCLEINDGGCTRTFTSTSVNDVTRVRFGSGGGMAYDVGYVKINSAITGGFPPTSLTDLTGLSDGTTLTAALMLAGTHCGNGTFSGTMSSMIASNTQTHSLLTPRSVCGTAYSGNVGVSIRHNLNLSTNTVRYGFTTLSTQTSVGFLYFHPALQSDNNQYDIAAFGTPIGDLITVETFGNGSARRFRLELSGTGGTNYADNVATAATNTWYWITVAHQASGTDQIGIYDATSGALLGAATIGAQSSEVSSSFTIGHVGGGTAGSALYSYYSDILLDVASGLYPILP